MAGAEEREWGHRFTHDGGAGLEASQGAAWAMAKRFKPGYVEIVWRWPGGEWQRADGHLQPHTPAELVASLERSRDWWRAQSNVRGHFVTRLRAGDFEEWRKAEREAMEPFNRREPGVSGE